MIIMCVLELDETIDSNQLKIHTNFRVLSNAIENLANFVLYLLFITKHFVWMNIDFI